MCEQLKDIVASLRGMMSAFDPSRLSGSDAAQLVELFSESERLSAAGRTLSAGRVAQTGEWRATGARTPAQWVASKTQGTMGQAIASVETAYRLNRLPATREAFAAGRLSEVQAAEISAAASADPASEDSLLELAANDTIATLRQECRQVHAAAVSHEDATERIRRGRYLRHWIERDGAIRLDGRFAPDDGAPLLAVIEADAARRQREAKRSGQREPAEAYAADALVALATGEDRANTVVHVEVDAVALDRGRVVGSEKCRIRGVGPIPVSVAQRLATNGAVKVIERKGVDVRRVAHPGRTIPAHVRTALEARDPICVVPGCDVRSSLEIDHIVPVAYGGPTTLQNLARLCRFHHGQKTHRGWRLGGSPGCWTWSRGTRAPPGS